MADHLNFYIDGAWVPPASRRRATSSTRRPSSRSARSRWAAPRTSTARSTAARNAFETFSRTTREERIALLENIIRRLQDAGRTSSPPRSRRSRRADVAVEGGAGRGGIGHFAQALAVLKTFEFEEARGRTTIVREPVGVVGMITPWNWPINQIACKVAPALAAGCTIVLKPTEVAPLNAICSPNHARGRRAARRLQSRQRRRPDRRRGDRLAPRHRHGVVHRLDARRHPGRDHAAPTVKRVTQELGGKSANIILDDADFQRRSRAASSTASRTAASRAMRRRACSCRQPAGRSGRDRQGGGREDEGRRSVREGIKLGPVVSEVQFNKIQGLIQKGIDEGAKLVTGGVGRPDGMATGFYVKPTVFAGVKNSMTIAREEIFGPVLAILPYESEEDAIRIANDTPYGLSGYVQSGDLDHARRVASRLRTGNVHLNGAQADFDAPFGGYKQSGNGREWGVNGFEEFLETKAVLGYAAPAPNA